MTYNSAFKEALLGHYASGEPTTFKEYVSQANSDITVQNANGDLVWSHKAVELMQGDFAVRVLIPGGTGKSDAIRLLEMIVDFVKVSGLDPDDIDEDHFI